MQHSFSKVFTKWSYIKKGLKSYKNAQIWVYLTLYLSIFHMEPFSMLNWTCSQKNVPPPKKGSVASLLQILTCEADRDPPQLNSPVAPSVCSTTWNPTEAVLHRTSPLSNDSEGGRRRLWRETGRKIVKAAQKVIWPN